MAKRHSSSVAIPRLAEAGARVLRLRADDGLGAMLGPPSTADAGRVVVTSREPLQLAEPVIVEISFGPLADEVELRGMVETIEERSDGAAPRVTIRIGAEHRDRANYVRNVLGGRRDASARNHRRIPTDLAASWRTNGTQTTGRVRDLSRGGAFLVSHSMPRVGEAVWVEITARPGNAGALRMEATVSWVRARGRNAGFGVCFKLRDRKAAAELHRVVREQERNADLR